MSRMFRSHVLELLARAILLAVAVFLYVSDRHKLNFQAMQHSGPFLYALWGLLAVEMVFRLIPNGRIALGARKHYACSYQPAAKDCSQPVEELVRGQRNGAVLSAAAWILGNAAVFVVLARVRLFSAETMVLLLLVYAVCDMICILFFCPFQVFFLKNRCCTVCRIYNWDSFMICTPLILFPSMFSVSLVLLSLAVLLRWELAYRVHPRFFFSETNENLNCGSCTDRLCAVRKPLGASGAEDRDRIPQKPAP